MIRISDNEINGGYGFGDDPLVAVTSPTIMPYIYSTEFSDRAPYAPALNENIRPGDFADSLYGSDYQYNNIYSNWAETNTSMPPPLAWKWPPPGARVAPQARTVNGPISSRPMARENLMNNMPTYYSVDPFVSGPGNDSMDMDWSDPVTICKVVLFILLILIVFVQGMQISALYGQMQMMSMNAAVGAAAAANVVR